MLELNNRNHRRYYIVSPLSFMPIIDDSGENNVQVDLYFSLIILSCLIPLLGIFVFMSYITWFLCFYREEHFEYNYDKYLSIVCLLCSIMNMIYIIMLLKNY